jgi:hypothetical protein
MRLEPDARNENVKIDGKAKGSFSIKTNICEGLSSGQEVAAPAYSRLLRLT